MVTASAAYCNFGYETTFKTPASTNKAFGLNTRISTMDRKNFIKLIGNLGTQDYQAALETKYEGALNIEFDITTPWFLKGIIGTLVTTGAGPYTHTCTPANSPPSMTVEVGIDLATDAVMKFLGVVVQEARITCEVGEQPAKCTLTCLYANESKASSGIGSQAAVDDAPFNFAYGSIEVPGASVIGDTQRVEVSIRRNAELLYGLGSRHATGVQFKQREYEITTLNSFDDASTYLEKMYGSASGPAATATEIATVIFKLNNGLGTTALRSYTWNFGKTKIDRHSIQGLEFEGTLMEQVTMHPLTLTNVIAVNNTSAMP